MNSLVRKSIKHAIQTSKSCKKINKALYYLCQRRSVYIGKCYRGYYTNGIIPSLFRYKLRSPYCRIIICSHNFTHEPFIEHMWRKSFKYHGQLNFPFSTTWI